jgi:flagellar biosynthesis anti-sigma factor FlgM
MSVGPKAKIPPVGETGETFQLGSPSDSKIPTAGKSADEQGLSPAEAQVRDLVAQAKRLPDVRLQKVAALRNAFDAGNYRVSPEQLADAMISAQEPWAGVGHETGEGANTPGVLDSEPLEPSLRGSASRLQQSRREFGSRVHDLDTENTSGDEKSREDPEASNNPMDSVA